MPRRGFTNLRVNFSDLRLFQGLLKRRRLQLGGEDCRSHEQFAQGKFADWTDDTELGFVKIASFQLLAFNSGVLSRSLVSSIHISRHFGENSELHLVGSKLAANLWKKLGLLGRLPAAFNLPVPFACTIAWRTNRMSSRESGLP